MMLLSSFDYTGRSERGEEIILECQTFVSTELQSYDQHFSLSTLVCLYSSEELLVLARIADNEARCT